MVYSALRGLWLAALLAVPQAAMARPLTLSTLPFDDPAQQEAVFGILTGKLQAALGQPVSFVASHSYDEVTARLLKGEIDVAFVGAGAYLAARKSGEVRAILRAIRHRTSTYRGVLLVKSDSDISSVAELRGKRVAFVDRTSTAGFLFARLLFKDAGIDVERDLEPVFAGSHHRVVELVAKGDVAAGACFEGAEDALPEPRSVRPIARTAAILGDPVVVRAGLGPELVRRLRSALIELATDPEARPFFAFAEIDTFVPALDRDYDKVAAALSAGQ